MKKFLLLLSLLNWLKPQLGEIESSADLSLTFEGPDLYLHQPNVAEDIGIWYKIDLNMYTDMKQDYNILLAIKPKLLEAIREFGYPKDSIDYIACRKQITEIESKAKSAMIITKKLEAFTDKGNIVGLELTENNTANINIPAERIFKEVNMHLQLLLNSKSDWQAQSTSTTTTSAPTDTAATTATTDVNSGRFRLFCSNLAQALDSSRHLVDILDVAHTHLNLLTNGKVPGTMLSAIDLIDTKSAGRFEFTEIDKCVKMQEGLKCILQSTSSTDSLKIRKLYSLPFLVDEQIIQIDWKSLQDPIVKANTLKIADKTGCHLTANRVNCPQQLVFKPNNCLEASVEGNVEKILKYCSFKHFDMQTEPFVYNYEGMTIVAQRNAEALTLKLSDERIFADPVKILHKDPLYISFNNNDSIIQGSLKVDEQKIITFKYNDSIKQEMALKSNSFQHFLQPFIPREWEVIFDMIGWALNVLGLILATKLTYDYVLKRCNNNNSDESNSTLPQCRRRLEIRTIKRLISRGETLSEAQYNLALSKYCKCANRRNDSGHRCPNIPIACYPAEMIPLHSNIRVRSRIYDNNIELSTLCRRLPRRVYLFIFGFLRMIGKSIYLLFGHDTGRHKHSYIRFYLISYYYRAKSRLRMIAKALGFEIFAGARIKMLEEMLNDNYCSRRYLISQVQKERRLSQKLQSECTDLKTKLFTLKKQNAKLKGKTNPKSTPNSDSGNYKHIQKKNFRVYTRPAKPSSTIKRINVQKKFSKANINIPKRNNKDIQLKAIRQKSMPLTFVQKLQVNNSTYMQTKNTLLIKALEVFLKAVRNYNINRYSALHMAQIPPVLY
jgi:hypothetical protein